MCQGNRNIFCSIHERCGNFRRNLEFFVKIDEEKMTDLQKMEEKRNKNSGYRLCECGEQKHTV